MDTRLSDLIASFERIEKGISAARQYNFSYMLDRYVDPNAWVADIRSCFSVDYVDNLTDFNYSNCFNYAINEGGLELYVGAPQLIEYLTKHGEFNRLQLLISTLGPYLTYRYLKYNYSNGSILLSSVYEPDSNFRRWAEIGVTEFCVKNSLYIIDDADLKRQVEGVSMDMAGENPSVFNLLFEDGASGFPY